MNGIEQQTKKPYEKPACQQSKKPYEKPTTSVLGTIGKWLLILCTVIVLVVAAVFFFAYRAISNTGAEIAVDDRIDVTPTHVELMKNGNSCRLPTRNWLTPCGLDSSVTTS